MTQLEILTIIEEIKKIMNQKGVTDFSVTFIAGHFFVNSTGTIKDSKIEPIGKSQ